MASETPRIEKVSVISPSTLRVKWRSRAAPDEVDLTGWIATGGDASAALAGRDVFKRAKVGNYGTAVLWDEGDLAIDAAHLLMLVTEQKEFSEVVARRWQKRIGLSNNEVADLLDTNNLLALAFGVLIVVLLTGGSLWIMANLNHNMMPMDQIMQR